MPYEIRQNGEDYNVVNTENQTVKATHNPPDAKEKAERQVKLLNAVENDPSWETDNG